MMKHVEFSIFFNKELSRLSRKFPRLIQPVTLLVEQLKQGELPGDKIPNVGYDIYKVRLPNPDAKRGKRGGFRTIYYVREMDFIALVTIYSKTEREDIAPEKLKALIEKYRTSG